MGATALPAPGSIPLNLARLHGKYYLARRVISPGCPPLAARYLAMALEFLLGADILSTAVAPTWNEIGKLGAIAVIRTTLNYFLSREMQEERRTADNEKMCRRRQSDN